MTMKLKGTLILTDPCYIIDKERPNDWDLCNYGSSMDKLGIEHFLTANTIYGDWSAKLFKVNGLEGKNDWLKDLIYDELKSKGYSESKYQDYKKAYMDLLNKFKITIDVIENGNFCADAGLVIATTLEEIENYNPNFEEYMKSHNWCVASYPDFDGEIQMYPNVFGDSLIIECKGTDSHLIAWQTGF